MKTASHNPSSSARQTKAAAYLPRPLPVERNYEICHMSSAGQGREEREPGNSCSSRAFKVSCVDLLHELASTTTAVLMNAQMLGWKLPPYSHLKRPLREIERNAQRGSELMKCLLRRMAPETTEQRNDQPNNEESAGVHDCKLALRDAVTAQEPASGNAENPPPLLAPGFFPAPEVELTSPCDACTSTFPKKG